MKMATSHQQPFSGYGNPILKCDTPSLTIDLMTILMGLSNLCSLTADGYYAPAALAITSRLSGSTVRYLAIDMGQPELDALSALGYITYFSSLCELCLHLYIGLESSECFTRLVPWNLIQLKKLTISWSGHDEHFNMSQFLGLCCLPALVALSLSGSLIGRESSHHLAKFFNTFKHIQEATLKLSGIEHDIFLPSLNVPCIELSPINAAMVTSLSPMTHTIRIKASDATARWIELRKMLQKFGENNTEVRTIRIYGKTFTWMSGINIRQLDGVPANIALVPFLLHYAVKIVQQGHCDPRRRWKDRDGLFQKLLTSAMEQRRAICTDSIQIVH
jgi:hypothetical protein